MAEEMGWLAERIERVVDRVERNRDSVEVLRRDVTVIQVSEKYAPTHDDIEAAKAEGMRYTDKSVQHVCDHLDKQLDNQSERFGIALKESQAATFDRLAQNRNRLIFRAAMGAGALIALIFGGVDIFFKFLETGMPF
jgi:hypothetical protein